jgi:hypothetical protein
MQLMREIFAYQSEEGEEIFSILSEMTYPSSKHIISSILIHEITTLGATAGDVTALADILCAILSTQWNQCLTEEYVRPLCAS